MPAADLKISRRTAAELGREAVTIVDQGGYRSPAGEWVDLRDQIARAREWTLAYPPDQLLPPTTTGRFATKISVVNDTTLAAARALQAQGRRVVALNFAAPTHPGGGFLTGARAQEQYLARSSALYACLVDQPMYPFHKAAYTPFASDYAIYSPDVPVFRGDDHRLLDEPYAISMVTCAAVQAARLPPDSRDQIEMAMRSRIHRILTLGLAHGHDAYVLGAWGCGAYGNDGDMIAGLFREAIDGPFRGAFAGVTFAVTDWSEDLQMIGPFARRFGAICDLG